MNAIQRVQGGPLCEVCDYEATRAYVQGASRD